MNEYKIAEFWRLVDFYAARNPQQRRGQATFNVLDAIRPDLAEQIRSTEFDAFNNDKRLDKMCVWITEHWDDKEGLK